MDFLNPFFTSWLSNLWYSTNETTSIIQSTSSVALTSNAEGSFINNAVAHPPKYTTLSLRSPSLFAASCNSAKFDVARLLLLFTMNFFLQQFDCNTTLSCSPNANCIYQYQHF